METRQREIKFRAWDTFNLRMVYDPYYFRKRDDIPEFDDERFNAPMNYAENWQDVDDGVWRPCHIMQYTGLKDNNGKEIYDSDRVKRIKDGIEGVVFWEYGSWRVKVDEAFDSDLYHWICYCDGTEVIGNIYEELTLKP